MGAPGETRLDASDLLRPDPNPSVISVNFRHIETESTPSSFTYQARIAQSLHFVGNRLMLAFSDTVAIKIVYE